MGFSHSNGQFGNSCHEKYTMNTVLGNVMEKNQAQHQEAKSLLKN
jgi:hypothetical protein